MLKEVQITNVIYQGVTPGQTTLPGPGGVGLTAALQNFASYFIGSNWGKMPFPQLLFIPALHY